MPLDRLVLILVAVIAAAGATIFLAGLLLSALNFSGPGLVVLIPALLVAYIVWRVIAERVSSSEDDHYDRIEK